MMDNSIRIPLDLPDVRVLEVSKTEEGSWLIRIERVCTDMYLGFVNAAREQLPRAHIIIDR